MIALFFTVASGAAVNAAEIKVISSVGVKAALEELAPRFERASEHKLNIKFGTIVPLKREIDAGETFDVVILTPAPVEDLVKQGKVAGGTVCHRREIGHRRCDQSPALPKPDISTADALKRTLLNAKLDRLFERGSERHRPWRG